MQAPHVWSDYNWCTRHASLYSRVAGVDRQPVQLSDVAQMCTVAPPSSSDEMKRNNFRQKSNMANGRRLEFLRSSHCVITVTQTDTPNYAEKRQTSHVLKSIPTVTFWRSCRARHTAVSCNSPDGMEQTPSSRAVRLAGTQSCVVFRSNWTELDWTGSAVRFSSVHMRWNEMRYDEWCERCLRQRVAVIIRLLSTPARNKA